MWTRKELKANAKKTIKGNYWGCVIVCLVLAFFAGVYTTVRTPQPEAGSQPLVFFRTNSNASIVEDLLGNTALAKPLERFLGMGAPKGVLANIFDSSTRTGSFVFGVLNAVNQFIFGDAILPGIIMLVGASVLFLYWMFVANPLRVGACRFFLEARAYPNTKANRLLYLYRIKRVRKAAVVMLLRAVFTGLWFLTIVGGIVMAYAWRLVPYIIAENPDIRTREAFRLSRQMMKGQKWRAFVLDLSFIWWQLLSSLTLGILSHLYVNPYMECTDAELYLALRQTVPEAGALLNDPWLATTPGEAAGAAPGEYPVNLYPIPEATGRAWMKTDFLAHYTILNLILIFFSFCMVGWVWEVVVDFFNTGTFVNRGTLYGPWLPIYGCGGVGVVVLFRRLGKNPLLTFFCVFTFCGVLEYFTSWALEFFAGKQWWDYTGYFMNINGRVCLEGLLVFGLGGCAAIYYLAPALNNLYNKIPLAVKRTLCIVLGGLFLSDLAISAMHPNQAAATVPGAGDSAPKGVPAGAMPADDIP